MRCFATWFSKPASEFDPDTSSVLLNCVFGVFRPAGIKILRGAVNLDVGQFFQAGITQVFGCLLGYRTGGYDEHGKDANYAGRPKPPPRRSTTERICCKCLEQLHNSSRYPPETAAHRCAGSSGYKDFFG